MRAYELHLLVRRTQTDQEVMSERIQADSGKRESFINQKN
jgi:hypothetical protein